LKRSEIAALRLAAQQIIRPSFAAPRELVAWLAGLLDHRQLVRTLGRPASRKEERR
jgi:hypothetical protein